MIYITFLDLFSGIGLFRLGFEMAGFICIGHCEIDKYANKSYEAMHEIKESEWFEKDIKKVKGDNILQCDMWTAGFPCQDISASGKRKGLAGERSRLFFEFIRLLHEKDYKDRPRWIILENVKRVLSSNGTKDFTSILCELAELGYGIEYAVLNSKNYGVPQNRERLFIIGDITGRSTGKIFHFKKTNTANIKKIVNGMQAERIYSINGIAPTLIANGGGVGGKTGLYLIGKNVDDICLKDKNKILNYKVRKLTPKEAFRLQGVPDKYFERVSNVCSDTQLYKQIGNSVTVPVVYEIGKKILEIINNERL